MTHAPKPHNTPTPSGFDDVLKKMLSTPPKQQKQDKEKPTKAG